jgi:hypothetical protein
MVFIKSIKREVGRNTGKVISNLFFGDKHSTPHRFITSRNKKKSISEKEKGQILEIERISLESKLKKDLLKTEHELELEKNEYERINQFEGEVDEEINFLYNLKIPVEEIKLIELLDSLDFKLKSSSWKNAIGDDSEERGKILHNKLLDAYLTKFEVSLRKLGRQSTELFSIYKEILKKHKRKRFYGKYKLGFFIVFVFILLATAYMYLYYTGELK